jgi:crotonobetaine/carnitine-CoA ligase
MRSYGEFNLTIKDKNSWVLSKILELRAETHTDRPFLQYMDEAPFSYKDVNQKVNRLAHGLARAGVSKGDRVLFMLPNSLEYIFAWFAINKLGAVEVPINNAYKGYFLEHIVNNSAAKVMLVDEEFLPVLKASEDNLPTLETLFVYSRSSTQQNNLTFKRYDLQQFDSLFNPCIENPQIGVQYYDLAAIIYTSGTTGPSKGVMMPHAQCYFFSEECVNLVRLTDQDVFYTCNPFFHANAQLLTIYPSLIAGAKVVVYPAFSASQWINQITQSAATVAYFIGVMMDFVFQQPERLSDSNNSLRILVATPTITSIAESFKTRFGVNKILDVYGMTEITLPILAPYDEQRPDGACGKLLNDWFEMRIVGPETDEDVPSGEIGEAVVRHKEPWIINAGYYGMPDKTAEAYRNLWFHTGDAMRVDENGWFYYVDRIKDAVRRRGENISSHDVEKVINSHTAIAECAVIAVKSEARGGEDEVMVCVVLKPGGELSPELLLDWCEDRMPYFAVPRFIRFKKDLPKTPNFKVQKHKLREELDGDNVWDRIKAGYKLKREVQKERDKVREGHTFS